MNDVADLGTGWWSKIHELWMAMVVSRTQPTLLALRYRAPATKQAQPGETHTEQRQGGRLGCRKRETAEIGRQEGHPVSICGKVYAHQIPGVGRDEKIAPPIQGGPVEQFAGYHNREQKGVTRRIDYIYGVTTIEDEGVRVPII
jgi:hypothetical protein